MVRWYESEFDGVEEVQVVQGAHSPRWVTGWLGVRDLLTDPRLQEEKIDNPVGEDVRLRMGG